MAGQAGAVRRRGVCSPSFEPVIASVGVSLPVRRVPMAAPGQTPLQHHRLRHALAHAAMCALSPASKEPPTAMTVISRLLLKRPASGASSRSRRAAAVGALVAAAVVGTTVSTSAAVPPRETAR
jgi:hypothetical protein